MTRILVTLLLAAAAITGIVVLGALTAETAQTFAAITRNEGALRSLVTDNARAFRTLSDRRERLAETIVAFCGR